MADQFNPKIPLYYQIKETITNEIDNNVYHPGDQIPPEIQLAEKYGVSRPTIRQAIMELVHEGILMRERGRGTFVSKKVIIDDAQTFTTFSDPLKLSGDLKLSLDIKDTRIILASRTTALELKIPYDTKIIEMLIIISYEDEPIAYRIFHIPISYFEELYKKAVDKEDFYQLFQKKLNSESIRAIQSFKSVSASEKDSTILSIAVGEPLTFWQGVIFDHNNMPISLVKTFYRGERIQFMITQGEGDQLPIELKENKE